MPHVEQAVFTSAETDRSAGYQVVAKSPGVCEADARELVVWGPSHDSLLELGPDAVSLNFHPLPSGAYCVSRTAPAGWEYSGRGGHRVYTHCLIVPPEVLGRFANNPFALIRAAQAGGMLEVFDQVPSRLPPLSLAGGAAPVDQSLLARLATNPGPQQVARLIQAAFDSVGLAVTGMPSAEQLFAGLFSCLPPACRTEFSFSTGLKFSSRRPFRIMALSDDRSEQSRVAHQSNMTVLDLSGASACDAAPQDGWARLIERVLALGRTSFLATQLSKRRFDLALEDLPALGLQLLEDLEASALRTDHRPSEGPAVTNRSPRMEKDSERESFTDPPGLPEQASELPRSPQRADAAHRQFAKNSGAAAAAERNAKAPSKTIDSSSPEILQKLEHLDDLVYEAISGRAVALDQLDKLWTEVLDELGDELVAESREQYLRYALAIWEQCIDSGGVRNPSQATQALDVLCVLFNEA